MPGSYALGDRLERFVDKLVKSGRYNSKSEVVREGLRLLLDREDEREAKIAALREAFRQGEESGAPIPAAEVFDRLEAKYTRMVAADSQNSGRTPAYCPTAITPSSTAISPTKF
jgi:antitoxin ParD1/3/4